MCLTMFPELWFTQAKDWNLSKCCSQYSDGVLSHARLFVSPWTVCSLPVFFVHGISQARTLEWVAISSSRVNGTVCCILTASSSGRKECQKKKKEAERCNLSLLRRTSSADVPGPLALVITPSQVWGGGGRTWQQGLGWCLDLFFI